MKTKFDFEMMALDMLKTKFPSGFARRPEVNKFLAQQFRFDKKKSEAFIDSARDKGLVEVGKRGLQIM